MAHPKVVIIGGGFAGLNVTKHLNKAKLDITLIDKTNHHLFQPLLYEIATAALSPGEIATPLREIVRHQENTSVIMGEVVAIDKKNREITLDGGEKLGYDYLVVAPGAKHSYFGNEGWEAYAPGLKTIDDALRIREKLLLSFEQAERIGKPEQIAQYLTFVVIGGGPTGVEMAGAIGEIAHQTLFKNFRKIRPETAKIYLIEACPYILPMYPQKLSERAKQDLEKLGVEVLVNTKVTTLSDKGVQTEHQFIASNNVIWAAGNQAAPLLKTLDTPLDRQGRVMAEKDLSIPGFSEIFVIGDASHLDGKEGKPLPGTAPVAIQQGKYVAYQIKKELPSAARKPFHYFDKGSMATIGKAKAIAMVGKYQFTGFFAWLMWAFVHILYLIGFRNRLTVFIQWAAILLTSQRGVRLITGRGVKKGS